MLANHHSHSNNYQHDNSTPTYTPPPSVASQPVYQPPMSQPELTEAQAQANESIDNRLVGRWRDKKGDGAYVFNSDGTGEFAAVDAMNIGEQQVINVNVRYTIPHWETHNGQLKFRRVYCAKEDDDQTNQMNTRFSGEFLANYIVGADGNSFTTSFTDGVSYPITYEKVNF